MPYTLTSDEQILSIAGESQRYAPSEVTHPDSQAQVTLSRTQIYTVLAGLEALITEQNAKKANEVKALWDILFDHYLRSRKG